MYVYVYQLSGTRRTGANVGVVDLVVERVLSVGRLHTTYLFMSLESLSLQEVDILSLVP